MQAIIPVAGAGTKLRPHTYTQPKALIPVAGKPILSFILDELIEAGVTDYIFVIGYLGEKIRDYVESKYPNLKVSFVEQDTRDGIGHAIWLTNKVVDKKEELIIVLGDSVFDADMKSIVNSEYSLLGVKKVDDPRSFGVAEINDDDMIVRVEEKPLIPRSNLALVGLYKIKETTALYESLNYLIENNIRTKNEFQLTDAIMRMIDIGVPFKPFKLNNWFDCGKKEVLLETNATLLRKAGFATLRNPRFEKTIIIDPVFIGENCKIQNSIIGPNVTVGDNATIQNSIIKESIIGNFTQLESVSLHGSVIGSDALIRGHSQSLNIGDNTEIDLS